MVIVSTVVISSKLQTWTGDIGSTLGNIEIENLNNRIVTLQKVFQDIYKQITSDTLLLEEYYLNILANYTGNQFYTSYSLVTAIDPNAPNNSTDASGYYESGNSSSYKNSTTLLDDLFRSVYLSNQKYLQLFVGFEDGFFRKYPFVRADNYQTLNYVCFTTGTTVIGYIPQCRSWYQLAKSTQNQVIFTPPYLLASTGKIAITSAKALNFNGAFIGVTAIDLKMEVIDQTLVGDTILSRGYSYVIDNTGALIFYPNLNRNQTYTITDYEGITLNNTNGNMTYSKQGESWIIVYSEVPNTNYIACISVPWSDIDKSKLDLESQSSVSLKVVIAVAVVALVLLTLIGIWVSRKISIKIIGHLNNSIKLLDPVRKPDPPVGKPDLPVEKPDRIDWFEIGNQAYYNGNWQLAKVHYEKVRALMERTNNKRGLGIVYSNKANTMRMIEGTKDGEIVQEYKKAIEIAESLLQNKGEYDERLLKSDLVGRFMNFGVYYMEKGENATANEYYGKALEIHDKIDDPLPIAIITNNRAQLYIQEKKHEEARKLLDTVISQAEGKKSEADEETYQRLLQYAYMNYGRLKLAEKNHDEAANYFVMSLNSAKVWDTQVAMQCASKLIEYHENMGNRAHVIKLQDHFTAESGMHVKFVLDTSGSMMLKINQCRKSILDIIKQLKPKDSVSLHTFNTTVTSIFVNYIVEDNLAQIRDDLETHTKTVSGTTAFYEALFESMRTSCQPSDWIVALTDGEDDASERTRLSEIVENYSEYLCNIVIIAVGQLDNERDIRRICDEAKKYGKTGEYIMSGNSEDQIAAAFAEAGAMVRRAGAMVLQDEDMVLRGDVVQQKL